MLRVWLVITGSITCGLAFCATSELTQEKQSTEKMPAAEIEKLVKDIGSLHRQTSEKASEAFLRIGEDTLPLVYAQEKKDQGKPREGGKPEPVPAQPSAGDVRKMLADIEGVFTNPNKYGVTDRERALAALRAAADLKIVLRTIAAVGTKDLDKFVRIETFRTLGAFGPLARDAAICLVSGLDDKEATVRRAAAEAVVQIFYGVRLTSDDPMVSRMVPSLRGIVKSEPSLVARTAAVAALRALGPAAKQAVPELLELAKDEKVGEIRVLALVALAEIGPDAKQATPLIMDLARKNDEQIGVIALNALGRIAPGDKDALALVMDRLKATLENKKYLTDNSVELGQIGHRESAVTALGYFGPAAEPAVPLLARVLEAKDIKNPMVSETIRRYALNTLRQIGPGAKAALPIASKIANDPRESELVRGEAKAFVEDLK